MMHLSGPCDPARSQVLMGASCAAGNIKFSWEQPQVYHKESTKDAGCQPSETSSGIFFDNDTTMVLPDLMPLAQRSASSCNFPPPKVKYTTSGGTFSLSLIRLRVSWTELSG